jgi:hypothetical protein
MAGSLKDRWDAVPFLMAGPILRQVTQDAVTVWVALKRPATVTLNVYDQDKDPGGTQLMTATGPTIAVGKNLHIVAITARKKSALSEGHVYFYDLGFNASTPLTLGQAAAPPAAAPIPNPFAYPPYGLPSFSLPPSDLNHLRLIHGSCRKPHGEGQDALAMLDGLIAETVSSAQGRPHQLLLTGDQIYADDVADALLLLLTEAGDILLGWTEMLPVASSLGGPTAAVGLPPYKREAPLKGSGFTSDDLRSHLMSLGEYFAMYLFAWSETLWPPAGTPLATYEAIMNVVDPGADASEDGQGMGAGARKVGEPMHSRRHTIEDDTKNVEEFRRTVSKVRHALANVPSYMICDDHEVTDDWNMTRRFCDGVYGNDLGIRVIQNALVAFGICQSWGNVPEQFADRPQPPAGRQLLSALQAVSALAKDAAPADYANRTAALTKLVGVNASSVLKAREPQVGYRVFHEIGTPMPIEKAWVSLSSLQYNFTIEGPSHQILVTDTRTWRGFPDTAADSHASLLPTAALDEQVDGQIGLGTDRLLLIVVTTNIPEIASFRIAANVLKRRGWIYENDLYDAWEFPTAVFDRLVVRLNEKMIKSGQPDGPVVFLSGDVHFGFSSRLAYWAEVARLDDALGQGKKAGMVFAQLVASAFKNEKEDTRGLHRQGYTYHPHWYEDLVMPDHKPEGYVGWNIGQGTLPVGRLKPGLTRPGMDLQVSERQPTLPTMLYKDGPSVSLTHKPDYRYRLDYLTSAQTGQSIPPLSPHATPAETMKWARDLSNDDAGQRQCVGFNNLGEITFAWDATKKRATRVFHKLRWQRLGVAAPRWVTYDISLDAKDPNYPPIPAHAEV